MAITVLDSWAFTNDDDPDNYIWTPSAGSDRVGLLAYCSPSHDISAFGWSTPTVTWGTVAPTATYKFGGSSGSEGSNEDDAPRYFALWDDAAIESRSGGSPNQLDWSGTVITNEFFGVAVYAGVQQTGLDSLVTDASDYASNQSSTTLTTTSSSGDRIIVIGGTNSGVRSITDWDTLTEQQDVAAASGNARYALGEGNGGDNSTVIVNQTFARPNFASIVLVQNTGGGSTLLLASSNNAGF